MAMQESGAWPHGACGFWPMGLKRRGLIARPRRQRGRGLPGRVCSWLIGVQGVASISGPEALGGVVSRGVRVLANRNPGRGFIYSPETPRAWSPYWGSGLQGLLRLQVRGLPGRAGS